MALIGPRGPIGGGGFTLPYVATENNAGTFIFINQ